MITSISSLLERLSAFTTWESLALELDPQATADRRPAIRIILPQGFGSQSNTNTDIGFVPGDLLAEMFYTSMHMRGADPDRPVRIMRIFLKENRKLTYPAMLVVAAEVSITIQLPQYLSNLGNQSLIVGPVSMREVLALLGEATVSSTD